MIASGVEVAEHLNMLTLLILDSDVLIFVAHDCSGGTTISQIDLACLRAIGDVSAQATGKFEFFNNSDSRFC